ncbi:MAG: ester cyclase [Armatimonadetes bacterium]|nr:ester cyclase [Armatimonadota bacterium]
MATLATSRYLEFVTTWFDRVWKDQDTDAIAEMFVEDGPAYGLGGRALVGPEGFLTFHKAMLELLSDVDVTVDHIIEQDDWFSYIGTFKGKCRRTGRDVSMHGGAMCRIVDGKMLEAYNTWDFLALYEGLGLVPEGAFERGLSGRPLCER